MPPPPTLQGSYLELPGVHRAQLLYLTAVRAPPPPTLLLCRPHAHRHAPARLAAQDAPDEITRLEPGTW
eukprot:COSAG01_NODE_25066_length_756_cov_22.961948_1_plen_69_part_00